MTVRELKRDLDRRFDRLERTKADKVDVRRVRSGLNGLRGEVRVLRGEVQDLRGEVRQSAEETRRHFDMVAESLRDDLRMFAEAIGTHSQRLDQHDARLSRLEARS